MTLIQNPNQMIAELYKNVDQKNLHFLNEVLDEKVRFRIGNAKETIGKDAVLAENGKFFMSITSMNHTIIDVWSENNTIICHGRVNYIRLNGSHCAANFSTVLLVKKKRIVDYLVFADLSKL